MSNWDLPNFTQLEDLENLELELSEEELLLAEQNQQHQITNNAEETKQNLAADLQTQFEAGFAAGLAQVQADNQIQQDQLQQELQAKIALMQELSTQFTQNLAQQMPHLEAAVLELSRKIAQAVIGFELQSSSNQQRIIIKQALRQIMSNCTKFKVRVNPIDCDWLEDMRSNLKAQISIISDERLKPGGCIIEAPNQLIDASIEQRLSQILAHLA